MQNQRLYNTCTIAKNLKITVYKTARNNGV